MQRERPAIEFRERAKLLKQVIPYNKDNFIHDTYCQRLNILSEHSQSLIIGKILSFKPEVIFIEPIYPGMKGMSGEVVNILATFLTTLQAIVGATHIITHHATRTSLEKGEEV